MKAKILCVSDLHKRWSDGASIKGSKLVQDLIQDDIIQYVRDNGITHIFTLGDWYHRGYHGLSEALSDIEKDRQIAACVNGNVYHTVGNHFFLERDDNPEMYIIQPCELVHPAKPMTMPKKPIFNCVPSLRIGTVQIDFFHFSQVDKNYVAQTLPGTTYHIGIYHDDCCLPGWIREAEGYPARPISQIYLNNIYNNIDLAIFGHIHKPFGATTIELTSGRTVPIIVPGSLGITANVDMHKTPTVDLPIITIEDDDKVSLSFTTFSKHLEHLTFKHKNKDESPVRHTHELVRGFKSAGVSSLEKFLAEKGHQQAVVDLVASAASGATLSDAIQVYVNSYKHENEIDV